MSKSFYLDRKGVGQLLKSQEVTDVLETYGNKVQERAGHDYEVSGMTGKKRASVRIMADSYRARLDNLIHNTLLKALNSSKG